MGPFSRARADSIEVVAARDKGDRASDVPKRRETIHAGRQFDESGLALSI
jgi:hypothetical protein